MAKHGGIRYFAPEQERDSQHRVPPRRQVKQDVDRSTPSKRRRATAGGRHSMNGGVKGDRSSGSRAGRRASRKARFRR